MNALTLTTAGQLKPGDVFYKFDDTAKTVFVVCEFGRLVKEKIFAVREEEQMLAYKEGLHWPDPIRKNIEVVFLKHKS